MVVLKVRCVGLYVGSQAGYVKNFDNLLAVGIILLTFLREEPTVLRLMEVCIFKE